MKKLTKLLVLVLSLALICGVFAIAAFAEEATGETGTETPTFVYTDKTSGEEVTVNADQAGLTQALKNVKANTTITLTADAHIKLTGTTAVFASLGNACTLDLGNHTLIVEQTEKTEHKITVGKSFTVQNGTLYLICTSPDAGSNDSYGKNGQTYPLFSLSSGASLTFNNLNTYAGALIYSYSSKGGTVTINGGTHCAVFHNRGTDSAWFNTRSNVNFVANNATFFTDGQTRIASFNSTYAQATQSTNDAGDTVVSLNPYYAEFNNCTLIGYDDTGAAAKLFNKAPSNLTVTFTDCDIYGTLSFESTSGTNTTLSSSDTNLHVKFTGITAENVIFKGKTTYANAQVTAGHVLASGTVSSTLTYSQSKTITINDVADTGVVNADATKPYDYNPATTAKTITLAYDRVAYAGNLSDVFLTADTAEGCNFTITVGQDKYYTNDLFDAIAGAPANATVTFNKDYYIVTASNVAIIDKAITIDLNGKTLGVSQSDKTAYFLINTTETVTVNGNGGMIVASDNKNISTNSYGGGYPIFRTSKAADLVLNNVNTCTGAIFYHHGASDGAKLTVNGGEHYGIFITRDTYSRGLVASRSNTTVVFNDAKIYMTYLNSLAYSSHSDSSATNKLTTFTYNNCYIVQSGDTHSLVRDINANTYLYFNDSYVYGLFAQEKNKGTYTGANIVFGEGSFWGSSGKTPDSGNYKADVNFTAADFTIAEGYNAYTISNGMSTKYEKYASGDFLKVTSADKFADTSANTFKTSAQTGSKFTYSFAVLNASDIDVEYVKGGKTHYAVLDDNFTFASVVENAQAGTTIKLHDDVCLTGLGTISIKKSLTIDLNGKTMSAENSGQNYILKIDAANVNFTLANGTLTYKHAGANTTHAFMDVYSALTGVVVNFNNLTTYTGMLLRNYAGNNVQVNINGGEHHMVYQPTNLTASYIESRANITLKANNAKFYLGGYSLFASCSYKQETGDKASSFTYTNCQILQTAVDKHVVQYANNYTTATFDNCDIYGKIQPVKNGWDSSLSNPTAGSFKLINGTTYMDGTTFNTAVDANAGYKLYTPNSSMVFDFADSDYDKTIEGTTITVSDSTADAWYKIIKSGTTYYYMFPAGTKDSLKRIIDIAATDSDVTDDVATLVLLKDIEIHLSASLTISKDLTIDLGGHTLYIEQGPVYNDSGAINGSVSIVTSKSVKFMNGTIMLAANSEYGNNKNDQKVSAIVQPSNGAKIYFKNVNTYGYAITYSWGNAYSVYVDGGEHHVNAKGAANMSYPGWICGGNNITAEVKNATIYLESTAANLIMLSHYKAGDTKSSVATFDNCTIVASSATHNIIPNMNNTTKITFTNSDIFGKIDPTAKPGMDSSASVKAEKGAIVIGAGCRFSDNVLGGVVVLADGIKLYDADMTETLTSNKASSLWNLSGFTLSSSTQNVTYNLADVTAVTGVDFVFEYVKDGKTYWTPETDANTFIDLFDKVDAGSTIKLLKDYTWNGVKNKSPQYDLTLDLGGFTLTVKQTFDSTSNYIKNFIVLQTATLTVQNGTIRTALLDAEGNETNTSYPFIRMNKLSSGTATPGLNLINVNTYGGTLIYNQDATGATINVQGGEHYLTNKYANVSGTFIECRGNSTVTVTGAKFYVSSNSAGLVTSMSYKTTSGDKASSFTFTDCEIYAESLSKNLIANSNEFTTFKFNNCKIVGSINPIKHSFESSVNGPKDGSIIFGMDTSYINGATLNYVTYEVAPGRSDATSIEVVFSDTAYGTKTASGVVMTVGAAGETEILFNVVVGGQTTGEYGTLADAIANAPAGATIKLLKDVTIDAYAAIATIDKALTIDLGGYHLQVVQYAAGGQIVIATTSPVVITNGRISCAADPDYRATLATIPLNYDVGEPLFVAKTVAVDLTFNNVSTYSAGLFYNTVSGSKFTVNGGYHQQTAITYPEKTYYNRALVISKANITVLFKNASIYLDWCGSLLVSTAANEADYSKALSTFTYEGCKVNFTGGANQIIRVANSKTFVYFKDSDVYGAFVKPVCKDNDEIGFTSANLHFDKDCTWYNTNQSGAIDPTLPEGYAFFAIASDKATISYDKYAITGTIQQGTLVFPTAPGTATFTVAYEVVDTTSFAFMITTSGGTTYYNSSYTLDDVVAAAPAGSTITFLQDYLMVTDRYFPGGSNKKEENLNDWESHPLTINKNLTIDLGGCTLTIEMHAKNGGFKISTTSAVVFQNGNIVAVSHEDFKYNNGEHDAKTSPVVQVSTHGANVTFNNVNTEIGALIYSYGNRYSVTVNGGVHVLTSERDANTPGFIAGQADITATVNNATFYVNYDYVVGASSYREFANISGGSYTADNFKNQISTTFTFNNCDIIAPTADKSVVGQANEFTKIYFNDCNIFGSITPTKNSSDTTYKYTIAGGKFISSPSACACESFSDTTGDGKCDNSGCSKYDPTKIVSYSVKTCPASNIVLGEGTRFSSSATLTNTTFANSYVYSKPASDRVNIFGTTYELDRVADYMYVTWYDETGAVIKIDKIDGSFNQLSDIAPEYEGKGGVTNGWYKIGGYVANAWTSFLGGTDAVDLTTVDLAKDSALYPQVNEGKISAYLTAAMYNLSTTGAIRNNFYIPETPDNVEILGVYVGSREVTGTLVLYRDYKGDPVYYNMYVINEVGAVEFTKTTEVVVKYKVNGSINLEQVYTLSPEKYANAVYNDSTLTSGNQYSTAAYNVVADLVRYSYLLSEYANVENEKLTTLYNKMSALCSKLPSDSEMVSSGTNVFELAGTTIAYEASSYEPRWKFTLDASAKVVDIKITLDGYHGGVYSDRTNFGPKTYGIEQATKDANGYIISAYTNNIPVYNITQPFTIIFTKADGTTASGTFDFKAYYNAVGKGTAVADFMKSVVALANSTIAYKYPDGKVSAEDVADFFSCDHAGAVAQATVVDGNYNFKPRLCNKCNSWLFYYEDYGAVADGKTNRTRATHVSGTNDYEAIYWTHANANEWKDRDDLSLGKNVAVVGNSNPSEAKYYYLSLPEGRGVYQVNGSAHKLNQNLGSITIATDTSWNGVHWIIDDDSICNTSGCTCTNDLGVSRKHGNYHSQSIFIIDEYGKENVIENLSGKISSLKPGDTNIGYAPGRAMLIYVQSTERYINYRYGANASDGVAINEILLVDEFGNIDPSTPVQWTYTKLTTVRAYAVDTDPIKISGLDSSENINSSYESYVNNSTKITIPHYVTCNRDITIQRSHATIEGIDRFFTEEPSADNYETGNRRYAYNFITSTWCHDATIKDMLVLNHNGQKGASGTSQGSYEFDGTDANATKWINCRTKNMFSNSTDGGVIAYPVYRGLFGTNRMRNMYLEDCYLNSFDAHTGAHNVTIKDSTIEHMNFVGGGDIIIDNVIIYTSVYSVKSYNAGIFTGSKALGFAFNLRDDYGSNWHGNVYIDGLTVRYGKGKTDLITIFRGSYKNQYYGFDATYVPQEIYINNFHIEQYEATVSNGVRTETITAKDSSAAKVYLYYAIDDLKSTDVPATSVEGASKPTSTSGSDYGTNHLECTKKLVVTNSPAIKAANLPTGSFWINMEVTLEGTKYVASKKNSWSSSYEWKAQ